MTDVVFNKKLREKVKLRDGYKCKTCPECENLTVHHVDGNRYNNQMDNLITLCERCHRKIHTPLRKVNKRVKKYLKENGHKEDVYSMVFVALNDIKIVEEVLSNGG